MAKVKLTRKTFSSYLSQNAEKAGLEGMFLKAFTGKDPKEMLADVADEQTIFIDTDRVVAVGPLTKMKETGDVVFQIYFDCAVQELQSMWFKGNQYQDFILAWAGKQTYLGEGEYKVGMGIDPNMLFDGHPRMWAEVSADGLTVTVHEVKPV